MSSWINFSILWMLTGSPVTAAVVLLAAYALADWYTFGFLRGLARAMADFRRGRRLRLVLLLNPHDRKARADLGDILLSQRRWTRVLEVVKPLADEDPHDLRALFLLGVACFATGRSEQGELFLGEIHKADPSFRDGAAALELGRWRLRLRDARAAAILGEFVQAHPHSVEARFLLSQAHRLAGDTAAAVAERQRCWREYETELPYQQRRDRRWAWRARPSRPALYAAVACGALVLFGAALQSSPAHRHLAADVRSTSP
ncbi:MAG TPA: tetratricopeptide repeat protein [Myxococcales bacterium]|nr:tetratricopeptide repeat protein [Myxococcales bacterium]